MRRLLFGLSVLTVMLLFAGALAAPAAAWDYRIQWGDSLYTIARQNGITVAQLRAANGVWSDLILAGAELEIPTSVSGEATNNSRAVDLLARLIHAEAGGEPFLGQVAVGAVVMNRLQDPSFPGSIEGVIFASHEFESVTNGFIWTEPTEENIRAAREAIGGWDPTGGAKYFFNPGKTYSAWIWNRPILTQIGNHVFSR
ncbi:MAG: cell wall hydrolase [Bacteroidota bacterium]